MAVGFLFLLWSLFLVCKIGVFGGGLDGGIIGDLLGIHWRCLVV